MTIKILFEGLLQGALPFVGVDGWVTVPPLNFKVFIHDLRRIFCENPESISNLLIQPGVTKCEHDVTGFFS